jgi:Na+-driven multidrug efflux pump
VIVLPVFAIFYWSGQITTLALDQNRQVSVIAQRFLRLYSLAVPALYGRMIFEQIMFSAGKGKETVFISLASFSIGILLIRRQ